MTEPFRCTIHLYGRFRLCDAATGAEIVLRGRKSRAIVGYLALAPDHRADREQLVGLLWGERSESQARANLRQAVLDLRAAARTIPFLTVSRIDIRLETLCAGIDVEAPARHFARGDFAALLASLEPVRERLLADLDDIDPAFDTWLRTERERRHDMLLAIGLAAVKAAQAIGENAIAARIAATLADIDDTNEAVARTAMLALDRAGDPAGVRRSFARLAAALERDLAILPSPETRALRERLCDAHSGFALAPPPHPDVPPVSPAPSSSRRRWPWIAASGLGLAAATGLALILSHIFSPSTPPPVVAVLPFEAVDGTAARYADTIWDAATVDLGGYAGIRMIGGRSARALAAASDASETGSRLGAGYLVEGSVQHEGGALRVSMGVVRTSDSVRIASMVVSGPANDLAALQGRVGSAIAGALGAAGPHSAPAHAPPAEAYALYLLGHGMLRSRDETQLQAAIPLFTRAVSIDPQFASGWSDLAEATWLSWELAPAAIGEDDAFASAMRYARRALALAPGQADAHAVLGMLAIGVDQHAALANLRRATTLDRGNGEAWYWLGNAELADAHYAAALDAFRQSVAIDPLWPRAADAAARLASALGAKQEAATYLARMHLGPDKAAALCIAARMAAIEGDHAAMLARGLAARAADPASSGDADETVRDALVLLGRPREATAFAPVDPLDLQFAQTGPPDTAALRARFGNARDFWRRTHDYVLHATQLVAAHRDAELVDLYRRAFGNPARMRQAPEAWFSTPDFVGAALPIAIALRDVGDTAGAERLLAAVRAAAAPILAAPVAPPDDAALAAMALAQWGETARASAILADAFARGWRPRIAIESDPRLATLHIDAGFASLAGRADDDARRQRARAQTISLSG